MTQTINKVTMWQTSDGQVHSSEEMAQQYVANADLRDALEEVIGTHGSYDAQDILNFLSGRSKQVRDWLDANDAAMKKANGL